MLPSSSYYLKRKYTTKRKLKLAIPKDPKNLNLRSKKVEIILNLLAFCVSISICTWQISICVIKYLNVPIGTEISVENIKTFTFPNIYLCPLNATEEMLDILRHYCKHNRACAERKMNQFQRLDYNFTNLKINLNSIWSFNSVMKIVSLITCTHSLNVTLCNTKYQLESFKYNPTTYFNSVRGRCRILHTIGLKWHIIGKTSVIWRIGLYKHKHESKSYPAMVSISTKPDLEKYLISTENLGSKTSTRLEIIAMKEFHRVHSSHRPCSSSKENTKCINDCFDQQIIKYIEENKQEKTPCILPFLRMANATKNCSNFNDVLYLFKWIEEKDFESSVCKCPVECHQILYDVLTKRAPKIQSMGIYLPKPKSRLDVRFSVNSKLVIKEYYTYTISALFGELAGNIGFFLGISLLHSIKDLPNSLTQAALIFKFKNDKSNYVKRMY